MDCETHLIKGTRVNKKTFVTSQLAPRMVCLSWADASGAGLYDRERGLDWLERQLKDPEVLLIGANTVYDMLVAVTDRPRLLRPVFDAYAAGRVRCVQVRQKLIDIAKGEHKFRPCRGKLMPAEHSLAALVHYWLDEHLEKADTWRLKYALLDGIALELWPPEAREYALSDAVKTFEVYRAQEVDIHKVTGPWMSRKVPPLHDEAHQNRAAWAMHLMAAWGVRTDPTVVERLGDALEAEHQSATDHLKNVGLMRVNGTKDLKAIRQRVADAYVRLGLPVPKTDTGEVSTAEDTLDVTADPDLLVLAGAASSENTRSTWLPALLHGAQWPICARYNVIVETGRTSCGSPNMQNPKRKGGLRECFVPRVGYLYAGADYDTLELRTLAQELLELCGSSAMADALMRGDDLHLNLAAELLGITVSAAVQRYRAGDKEVEEARQLCKVANFGFPGGMIARTFVEYAAGYGVTITLAKAQQIHDSWRRAWPEMAKYFAIVQGMIGRSYTGEGTIIQSMSKRVRGGVKYCAACNTRFQGRAGDGAKEALWRLAVEEYTGRRTDGGAGISPLYGSRTVIFMHDECILEVPEASASGAAARLGEVMREAMAVWVPSIPIKAGPVLMRRWFKGAKAVQVEGRLVPAKPLKDGKNTKWVADA